MKRPFEQAVTQHGTVVLRVCRAVLGVDEADDAWSETFLSALRAWPDLPDDADVRAWLVTIAHRIGRTNAASRAVGLANGSNPIPIVIPCHRVVGADGSLVGYAGGLGRKRHLLALEEPHAADAGRLF